MKKTLVILTKIMILTLLFLVFFSLGGALIGPQVEHAEAESQGFAELLLVGIVNSIVCTLVILRSNWSGWKLILATGISYYGVQTFMSQIETAYFGPAFGVPSWMLPRLFMMSLPVVLIFIPLAVIILGKGFNQADENPAAGDRLRIPITEWAWKLAVISVMYLVLYFSFGYFVAWSNPDLAAMYGNGANQEIFDNGKLIPFQLLRSVLWVLFSLPVIRMSKGNPLQIGMIVGILLSLPMNIPLLLPNNPFMPNPGVRMSHFIETASSNFIFGTLLTLLILWRPGQTKKAVSERQLAGV